MLPPLMENTQVGVGEYTVFAIGNPLRNLRTHSFWVENTQVDCWRIHSFHYRKSLKEIENTQFLGGEYTSWLFMIVGEYTVLPIGNPLRKSRIHSFWVENTQVDCWRIHSFSYRESLEDIENTQFSGGEYTSRLLENTQFFTIGNLLRKSRIHNFFGWRIHKLIVGEYTVFRVGSPLRKSRTHSFWGGVYTSWLLENTLFYV
jgi:hypothetical protein